MGSARIDATHTTGGVMAKGLILVVAASIAIGLAVGLAAGRLIGTGAFAAAFVLGAILVVLRRNQKDLRELEQGLVPPEVDQALGEPPPPER
jgi:hypothetical protein